MLNLASVFDYSAKQYPDKTAVVCGTARLSYGQLHEAVNRIANGLVAAGIGKGDNVALSCLNLPYFPMVYYAILKVGATVVPLNVLSTAREIAYYLNNSNAKAYFCFQGTPELPMSEEGFKGYQVADECEHFWVMTVDPVAPSPITGTSSLGEMMAGQSVDFDIACTNPEDTAVILYTSGTTGTSKGAELSHSNMTMNAVITRECFVGQHDDVHIITLPLFHSFGQTCQLNAGFSLGNTLVLIPRFTAEAVFDAMQNEKGTIFVGVPTMYWALLNYEDTEGRFDMEGITERLRLGASGGSALPLEILRGIEEKYQIPILEGYGLSETCPVATFNQRSRERKPGSVGAPIWGIGVNIVDSDDNRLPSGAGGEVIIRGHNIMKGYYGKPEETKAALKKDGWFYTGDLGRLDEDGYLYIVDRLKEMIIRGGFNVYPREVEEVLMSHHDVSLVAVLGVPHDQHGEEIKAYVVLKAGAITTEQELIAWGKEQMASFKYPRIIEFRKSLPMTATGKILKKDLKAEMAG
ncbi:MAG: long-chain fatty acid--CoA ligase [Candidatus Marinimicrobia bacterium]|nr:long-chain fatty acid--CoA ligase [Candidatus Neomarinimicrobiota bacterium]